MVDTVGVRRDRLEAHDGGIAGALLDSQLRELHAAQRRELSRHRVLAAELRAEAGAEARPRRGPVLARGGRVERADGPTATRRAGRAAGRAPVCPGRVTVVAVRRAVGSGPDEATTATTTPATARASAAAASSGARERRRTARGSCACAGAK